MLAEELMPKVEELKNEITEWERKIKLDNKLSKSKRRYKAEDRELIAEIIAKNQKKITDYCHLFDIFEGDLVTTLVKNRIGTVIGNCNHKSPLFVWITWGRYQTLISSHVSSIIKLEKSDTKWQWNGKRFYRNFDDNTCEDLEFLFDVITNGEAGQSLWAKSQYNLLAEKLFSTGDSLIRQGKYYELHAIAMDENGVICFICISTNIDSCSLYPHEVSINYTEF